MDSTSSSQGKRPPAWRRWVLVVGAVILYLWAIGQLERLLPAKPRSTGEVDATRSEPPEAARPTITRIEDGVEVSVGFHRTTVRLGKDEASVDELIACMEDGFERAEADREMTRPASPGLVFKLMSDKENAERVNRIIGSCLQDDLNFPEVPELTE